MVNLPSRWNPGPYWRESDFFGGLKTPWLRLAPLPDSNTVPTYDGELVYGSEQRALELGSESVDATRSLTHTSRVLGQLLANENTVTDRLAGAALQASSYSARPTPKLAATQVLELDATTRVQMERVQVTGTDFVTLSGGSGSLTVTLVNGLKQPITVGLRASADSPRVRVATPEPVNMQPGQRTTLRLKVTSGTGVHDVTLTPVTTTGQATGTPLTFSLRTSTVGRLIWYILAAGRHPARRHDRAPDRAACPGQAVAGDGVSQPPEGPAEGTHAPLDEPAAGTGDSGADSRSLLTSTAVMAAGTVVSRLSGFVRGILLAAALGVGLHADVFNIANTVPNMLYILLAGGVVNAVLVPQLVRAMKNDPDGGEAYTNRIITLAGAVPGVS